MINDKEKLYSNPKSPIEDCLWLEKTFKYFREAGLTIARPSHDATKPGLEFSPVAQNLSKQHPSLIYFMTAVQPAPTIVTLGTQLDIISTHRAKDAERGAFYNDCLRFAGHELLDNDFGAYYNLQKPAAVTMVSMGYQMLEQALDERAKTRQSFDELRDKMQDYFENTCYYPQLVNRITSAGQKNQQPSLILKI